MFFIENEGQAVARTDYWQSVQAQAGYVYLSWNAGAARLLVPDAAKHLLREMRGAEYVIPGKYRVVENLPDVSPWSEH